MRNRLLRAALAVAVAGSLGCATPRPWTAGELQPSSGSALRLRFSSDVPEPYYVLSGPADSYQRLHLNDRFLAALQEFARREAPAAAAEPATVQVHLLSVSTTYRELGAPTGDRLSLVQRELEGDPGAPEELTKGVTLTLRVSVTGGGKAIPAREIRAEATEVIDRYRFDRRAYDYSPVIDAAIRKGVDAVDRTVAEALG